MPPKISRIQQIAENARANRAVTLVYKNVTKTGLKGGITQSNEWEVQGYSEQYDFSVWINADAFATIPETDDRITVDNTTRRILGVRPDSIGALIRLDLGGKYGGA